LSRNEKSLSAEGSLQSFVWCFVGGVTKVYINSHCFSIPQPCAKLNTTSLSAPVEALEEMKPLV